MSTIAPQPEGRSRAKAQEKHMGRVPAMTPEQQKGPLDGARRALRCKELAHSLQSYNVGVSTIRRATALYDRQIVTSEPV